MKKIIFLCNWGESSVDLLKRYSSQTPNNSGVWDNIMGVSDISMADYHIILEGSNIHLSNDKSIFVKREPDFIHKHSPKYKHVISWDETNCGVTWWVNKSYDELKAMPYPDKTKDVSCVVSSKHQHRANYVKSLFKSESPIDLYGRGHNKALYGDNYKGTLDYDGKCKLRGLMDYNYSIVLENSQQKNYWTEKLADAYLSWCVPLYWGCPNMVDFFPENSYISINTNDPNPIEAINEAIQKPVDIEALTKARNIVLDDYNLWEVINKKIKQIENEIL